MSIGIYKITSPSGKIYIGQSINIENRWKTYKRFIISKGSLGPKLYNSLQKYGWEQHVFEIIEECSIEQLNEKEIYWKQHYLNLFGWKNVLFCEIYDNGGGPKSEETKKKQSKGLKKAYNENRRKSYWLGKQNIGLQNYLKNNSGFKYKRNENHKQKLSLMMKNVWMDDIKKQQISLKISQNKKGKNCKKIKCDTLFGIIFDSINEASERLDLSKGNISSVLKGKLIHTKGFTFSYIEKR